MTGYGRMVKNMGKGLTLSPLGQSMTGYGRMGKNMGKAHLHGPMGISILENGMLE